MELESLLELVLDWRAMGWSVGIPLLACTLLSLFMAAPAQAVPSYARQTGLPCTTCHTAFPQLTPFGRYFKMSGYTLAGGDTHLPPVAVMLQGAPGFTHTQKAQSSSDVPSYFDSNNNVSLNQVSFFYSGRLFGPYAKKAFGEKVGGALDHVGTFIQGTWSGVDHAWAWDNAEIRVANTQLFQGKNVIYGAYANNNPTMQDPWNSTPAWGFPFSGTDLAPTPDAAPLIAGGFAQQVGGMGAYVLWNDMIYLDAGAYANLTQTMQKGLGVDPTDEAQIDGLAPYWRAAIEKNWGSNSVEFGTFGMSADTYPGGDKSAGSNHQTDVGLDLQYQWLTNRHEVTVLTNWIHEDAHYSASQQLGEAQDTRNQLWSTSATVSYLFDKTYGANVQFFHTEGSGDPLLYDSRTGRPNSTGWVFQIDWLPFNKRGGPKFWPHSNVKFAVQYYLYTQFNGSSRNYDGNGRNAEDNNTIFLQAWWAF